MVGEELSLVAQFEVRRRAYVAADGTVVADLPSFASDRDLLVSLYRAMVLTRTFDLRAVSLQRTGRLGTYAVSLSPADRGPTWTGVTSTLHLTSERAAAPYGLSTVVW